MLDFYTKILGFDQMFLLTVRDFKDILKMPDTDGPDSRPWLVYLRVAPEQYLEMFAGEISPPGFARNPVRNYPDAPLRTICFYTDNIERTSSYFLKNGLRLFRAQDDPASRITPGDSVFPLSSRGERFAFLLDPEGNYLQIVERLNCSDIYRMITGICSIRLLVNDIRRSAEFYRKIGFSVMPADVEAPSVRRMTLGADQSLELVEIPDDSAFEEVKQYPNAPMGHLALQVYSLEETAGDFARKGVTVYFNNTPPLAAVPLEPFDCTKGRDGCLIGWIFDPDGNKLEIMEQTGTTLQQEWEKGHKFA
jgi:catechol 2,3-dioxygenase-like lactoylglutathione lyase family enzyme